MKGDPCDLRHKPRGDCEGHQEDSEKRANTSPASSRHLLFHWKLRANEIENQCNNSGTAQRPKEPEPQTPKNGSLSTNPADIGHDVFVRVRPLKFFDRKTTIAVSADRARGLGKGIAQTDPVATGNDSGLLALLVNVSSAICVGVDSQLWSPSANVILTGKLARQPLIVIQRIDASGASTMRSFTQSPYR